MKPMFAIIALLFTIIITSLCFAVPTLTTPSFKNVGANLATLTMQSSDDGTGYFTLLSGSNANCGNGDKVAFGPYSSGSYHGSLPLFANISGNYTVRNLKQNAPYTVCFTADSPRGSNLNTVPVASNLSTNSVASTEGLVWRTVPAGSAAVSTGAASFTSLAFSPDGTPYVAYSNDANSGKTTVRKYSGGAWDLVGIDGFSVGITNYTSLAFAPDGIPYVAYSDDSLPEPDIGKATVRKYNGTSWELVGNAGFSAGHASYTSLAFDLDGTPYLVYGGDDDNPSRPTVMKLSSNTWIPVGGAEVSTANARYTSLAFAPNGTPYVAYADDGNSGKVSVKKFNGTVWENVVGDPDFPVYDSAYISLAISPDGIPHVAYSDYSLPYPNTGKATVRKYNGSAWDTVGDSGNPGFSSGQASSLSLAFDPDGKPCVAYLDASSTGKATVMQFSGTQWDILGSADFSAGTANFISLAFAPDGSPYVAYGDDGNGSRATVMKLANMPTISGTPAAIATIGVLYSFTPTTTYATSFSVTDNLPPGLSLNLSTGVLSGTPTTIGTYSNIVITATNSVGSTDLPVFSIVVTDGTATGSVRVFSTLTTNSTISAALETITGSDTLQIIAGIDPEMVNYSGSEIITLEGGFNNDWSRSITLFSPVSSLTITSGTLILDRITVQ